MWGIGDPFIKSVHNAGLGGLAAPSGDVEADRRSIRRPFEQLRCFMLTSPGGAADPPARSAARCLHSCDLSSRPLVTPKALTHTLSSFAAFNVASPAERPIHCHLDPFWPHPSALPIPLSSIAPSPFSLLRAGFDSRYCACAYGFVVRETLPVFRLCRRFGLLMRETSGRGIP